MPETRLGPYVLRRALAEGGMATLYIGVREGPAGFQRAVAIKAIKREFAHDEDFIRMFLDEARIVTRIRHPNVVHIEELGEEAGTFYLVMELVTGISIAALLRALAHTGRRLRPATAVAIAMRVAAGLHAAHETRADDGTLLNVVHRDVSPQNILLSTSGQVKLIDFGIAKARDRLAETAHGQLKGKLRYMSPEQMRRKAVDRRSDIFALAIVLWEMLTLRRIFFKVADVEVVKRVMNGDFAPAGAFASVPLKLDQLVLACLSADPSKRPATAHEMRTQLRAAGTSAVEVDDVDLAGLCWYLGREDIERMVSASGVDAGGLGVRPPSTDPKEAFERLTLAIDDSEAATMVAHHHTSETGAFAPPAVAAALPRSSDIEVTIDPVTKPATEATDIPPIDAAATVLRPTFGDETLRRMKAARDREQSFADASDTDADKVTDKVTDEATDEIAQKLAAATSMMKKSAPQSTPRRVPRRAIAVVFVVMVLVAIGLAVALLPMLRARLP